MREGSILSFALLPLALCTAVAIFVACDSRRVAGGCKPDCSAKCAGESDGCGGVCGDPCNAHGTCSGAVCVCNPGYSGATCHECAAGYIGYPDCAKDPCVPDPCSGHGTCNGGDCVCGAGYAGAMCSECATGYLGYPDCAKNPCDPDPCNGHGTCSGGACTCDTGYNGPGCDWCATGYDGYPSCVPAGCGDYAACCCVSDACGAGNICNQGLCVSDSCAGKADFTLCKLVTDPDRSYDICVDGTCVSPGCGDATCNEPGPHFRLPDTGQRECYSDSEPLTCTPFPCDRDPDWWNHFCGQDAQYGWDTTHGQAERFTRTEPVPDEPVVSDEVTGLAWQGCSAGLSGAECTKGTEPITKWADALSYCDGLDWGGQVDWRLPDSHELQSIVDYGRSGPSIDATVFPATVNDRYWSSSAQAGSPLMWEVNFSYGLVTNNDKTFPDSVRCVRGIPNPQPVRFSKTEPVTGEPVIADNTTGLSWQGCPAGLLGNDCATGSLIETNWEPSLRYCEELSWANQTDWRLPSVIELAAIVDRRRREPSTNTTAFPATPADWFCTSSSYAFSNYYAWFVDFADGWVYKQGKSNTKGFVRCVRGGL
ncbi:MAG: DUF1566 domain-containing protein [Deltaproteobacteria bacterium]|nr:DUF1566 domain-containing protein [Deltaproteobacteria bacterium]